MLELARLRVRLLVANLEQERVAFETVGDLQQCQSQRGTSVRRELGRFGRELEQQTFVIEAANASACSSGVLGRVAMAHNPRTAAAAALL